MYVILSSHTGLFYINSVSLYFLWSTIKNYLSIYPSHRYFIDSFPKKTFGRALIIFFFKFRFGLPY